MNRTLPDVFPGTNRQIIARSRSPQPPDTDRWDAHPREYSVGGKILPFYTVGALAKALGRRPVTIRRWEREGIIPAALWRSPHDRQKSQLRLYSREQVEGMMQIAREEGLYNSGIPIKNTNFQARVYELFVRLAQADAARRSAT